MVEVQYQPDFDYAQSSVAACPTDFDYTQPLDGCCLPVGLPLRSAPSATHPLAERSRSQIYGAKEIRTPDPLNAIEVRYQLRYSPEKPNNFLAE